MSKINHIVFDIGKVLIHYDPHIPYSRLIPDDAERAWFFENVCTHDWNLEQDRGRKWADAEACCWKTIRTGKSISAPSANIGTRWSPTPMTIPSPSSKV